jgi:hypothetical protein
MPHDSDDIFEADNATRQGRGAVDHPTMLSSCARAATAAEARFRVPYPNSRARRSRIFALDATAAEAMYRITEDPWTDAHFLTVSAAPGAGALRLGHPNGIPADLDDELEGADVAVLIASEGGNEHLAEAISRACFERNIMCAGLALAKGKSGAAFDGVVNSMRRFARVLVVAQDEDYIPAMLTALRA